MHETSTGVNPAMSEKHVDELIGLYTALFKDALSSYPTLGTDFERDLTRLLGSVKQRGIQVFLVDLPAVGKHLDRCFVQWPVHSKWLTSDEEELTRRSDPAISAGTLLTGFSHFRQSERRGRYPSSFLSTANFICCEKDGVGLPR